ncbi:unnamed protein product [Brassica oleracea]|uniref:(rape) hypothetical protein n=1 Tax=Brassica napus TaxID=3708 RepID=A0A816PZJ8_BRANA|nr:unnamed protein product [Brassica napus]
MKLYHFALRIGPYDDDYVCVSARRNLGKERNMLKVETIYGRTLVWVSRLPVTPLKTDELKAVGVDEVVLAINYQPEVMLNFLKDFEAKLEIKITFSQETERMDLSPPLFSLTTLHLLFFFFNCSSETKHLDQTPRPHHVRLKKSKALISET